MRTGGPAAQHLRARLFADWPWAGYMLYIPGGFGKGPWSRRTNVEERGPGHRISDVHRCVDHYLPGYGCMNQIA